MYDPQDHQQTQADGASAIFHTMTFLRIGIWSTSREQEMIMHGNFNAG
jgi:hypothetical protein